MSEQRSCLNCKRMKPIERIVDVPVERHGQKAYCDWSMTLIPKAMVLTGQIYPTPIKLSEPYTDCLAWETAE